MHTGLQRRDRKHGLILIRGTGGHILGVFVEKLSGSFYTYTLPISLSNLFGEVLCNLGWTCATLLVSENVNSLFLRKIKCHSERRTLSSVLLCILFYSTESTCMLASFVFALPQITFVYNRCLKYLLQMQCKHYHTEEEHHYKTAATPHSC